MQVNTPDLSCRHTQAQQVPPHYCVNTKKKSLVNAASVEGEACSFVEIDLQLYYGYLASLYI